MKYLITLAISFIIPISSTPCKMSPLTRYLTDDQQQTLHHLIISARTTGADEEMVKESMDEYLAQILPTEKLLKFKTEHDEFEAERRGRQKRSNDDKKEPKKVFDILDKFNSEYQKFYEETSVARNRNLIY